MSKKSNFLELEDKYKKKWDEEKTYTYQDSSSKPTFVIDTPPPTVSGSLHIGHVFSYTQTDILARFHRMQGKNIFYPMGWDDNGLPTEKRVQKLYAVRCDPKQPYNPSFKAQKNKENPSSYQALSPENFSKLCHQQTLEDENQYKKLMCRIALSVDWSHTYRTIGSYAQTLAQLSFLDLYEKQMVDHRFSPVLWDTQFQTAIAGADIEDREVQGAYHDIAFAGETGKIIISTTRPELLPACMAIAAHPEDERYKKFFGKTAITPLFYRKIPILPSSHADPKKGTGALMICTFGDKDDVDFWEKQFSKKQNERDTLQIISEEGLFKDIQFGKKPFFSTKPKKANMNYSHLKGLRVKQARKKMTKLLKDHNHLTSEPKACLQHVKFYEKGEFPLEILPKRQWYIKLLDHKDKLLEMGRKIHWHPSAMRKRYEQWVLGLNQDWCVSRQRFHGVPFPIWYKVDEKGFPDYNQVIIPQKQGLLLNNSLPYNPQVVPFSYPAEQLTAPNKSEFPINPLKQVPQGFTEEQRDQPGGFTAESHVMDTWATSSLTPYINSGWLLNSEKHKTLFPADLRPQAHEIIRTWAFYTIVKAYFHENRVPWKNIAISGWLITPERKKMSKSKGKTLSPEELIDTYSADAVRYLSAKARLGQDSIYDEQLVKTGHRLLTKILNASRFVQMQVKDISVTSLENHLKDITVPIDQAWLSNLLTVKIQAITCLENYNYAEALENIEKSFWLFCDNYIELVKARVYQCQGKATGLSGKRALDCSLYIFLKLFAPYFPYVTEEIWQNRYNKESSSIHNSLWLEKNTLEQLSKKLSQSNQKMQKTFLTRLFSIFKRESENKTPVLDSAFSILEQVRSQKADQKKSLASPLEKLEVKANSRHLKAFELVKNDIAKASHISIQDIITTEQTDTKRPIVKIQIKD